MAHASRVYRHGHAGRIFKVCRRGWSDLRSWRILFCQPGESPNHSTIRLTFGVQSAESIERGIRILSEQVKRWQW